MRPARRGLQLRSQRRGVTPLVLFWKRSGQSAAKSAKRLAVKSSRVQGGDAVDGVAGDDCQVRHADHFDGAFLDERQGALLAAHHPASALRRSPRKRRLIS